MSASYDAINQVANFNGQSFVYDANGNLTDDGQRTYDLAQRKAVYRRLQTILHDQMPVALLYQRPELDAFTDRLQHQTTSLSTAWWNVGAWTLAP